MVERISNFLIVQIIKRFFLGNVSGIENIPDQGPYVIVANHASYFDHFLITTVFKLLRKQKVYFITKKEAFDSYLSRAWHLSMGAIPLNRNAADTAAFRAVIAYLKEGKVVCIYPEGTRSPTGKMYTGKSGAVRMALLAKSPLLPVGMTNTFDILPKNRLWPRFNRAHIVIGKPIILQDQWGEKDNQHETIQHVMSEIRSLTGHKEQHLTPLPDTQESLEKELIDSAYEWNERGIRGVPNDSLSPTILHKRAAYMCDEVLKTNPTNASAYYEKARALGRMAINGNFVSKIKYAHQSRLALMETIKLNPEYAPAHYALGMWFLSMPKILGGNVEKSILSYKKAAELAPREIFILTGLAKCQLSLKKLEDAKHTLLKIAHLPAKNKVDSRRKMEALVQLMRIEPNFQLESEMISRCLENSQTG